MPALNKKIFLIALVIVAGILVIIPAVLSFVRLGVGDYTAGGEGGVAGTGLIRSQDGGETWSRADAVEEKKLRFPSKILDIVFHPKNADILFLGAKGAGLWKSNTGGKSWQKVTDALKTLKDSSDIFKIAMSRSNPRVIYVAAYQDDRGRVLRSDDEGGSFREIYTVSAARFGVFDIYINPSDEDDVSIITGQGGILETKNGGRTWRVKKWFGESLLQLLVNPFYSNEMYLITSQNRLYKTSDGGELWNDITEQIGNNIINNAYQQNQQGNFFPAVRYTVAPIEFARGSLQTLVIDPFASHTLYLGFSSSILRTYDAGVSWENINIPIPPQGSPVSTIAISPKQLGTIFTGAGTQLYKSTDKGINWKIITLPTTKKIKTFYINPLKPEVMLGVFQ